VTVPSGVADRLTDGRVMAHLATSVDDRPHVAPVWFTYEDGVVRVVTDGKKLANVRANPRVAVSVQADDAGDALWRVALLGTATVVEDTDRVRDATREIYTRYMGDDPADWDAFYREQLADPSMPLLEIDVGSATLETYEPVD
jgi:nitroimidazol reductase NimA-like FMN-containing flavoprotein (pyridoxamine 5'-phosphate oxidase superfamily)